MNKDQSIFDSQLNIELMQVLATTVKWGRMLGIFMIISSSIYFLMNVSFVVKYLAGSGSFRWYIFSYFGNILLDLLQLIPAILVIKMSNRINRSVVYEDATGLTAAFTSFKGYLKAATIFTIAGLIVHLASWAFTLLGFRF